MWKIFFFIIITSIISIVIFLGIKFYPFKFTNQDEISGAVLADTAESQINDFFDQTKDTLQETSQNLIETVKDQTYSQTQNTVDAIFNKSISDTTVAINILQDYNPPPGSFIIDFSKDSNLKLSLNKGVKYYLQFKNIPTNYCLYIIDNKYQIIDTKIVELQFNSSGTYPIRLNSCEVNDKNLGELVVQ